MARLVLMDSNPQRRQSLAELLRKQGHGVEAYGETRAAILAVRRRRPELLLISTIDAPGVVQGLEPIKHPPRRALFGPPNSRPESVEDTGYVGFIEEPFQAPAVQGLLRRLLGEDGLGGWSGPAFLERVDGRIDVFPPIRVLFLAHRVSASGRLLVSSGLGDWDIQVRQGRIVGCTGVTKILAPLGIRGGPGEPLNRLLSRAIAEGHAPDRALQAASLGLGMSLAQTVDLQEGRCSFDLGPFEGQRMLLPARIPSLISAGLNRVRPGQAARSALGRRRNDLVVFHAPDDSPEQQWGLTPVALRLMREAVRVDSLGELVGGQKGGENDDVWLAVDLLLQLGILSLQATKRAAVQQTEDLPEDGEADTGEITVLAVNEPELAELLAARARMREGEPWEVLELTSSKQVSVGGVTRAHLEISARYHPDRFAAASEQCRKLAAECFSLLADAREALQDETLLAELGERLVAKEAGRPYATPAERAAARLMFRKGELAFNQRNFAEAWRLLHKAETTDPTEWRYQYKAAHAGWLADEVEPAEVMKRIDAITGPRGPQRADLEYLVGEILLKLDKEREAHRRFNKAVEYDPEHIAARRHLRLREMRSRGADKSGSDKSGSDKSGSDKSKGADKSRAADKKDESKGFDIKRLFGRKPE